VFRLDRIHKKGGGVCILVKKDFICHVENNVLEEHFELLHLSLDCMFQKPLQLISLYRTPSSSINRFCDTLDGFLSNIEFKNLPLIIMGDFNYDALKCSKKNDKLLGLVYSYGLSLLNDSPTRISNESSTQIDWILSNGIASKKIASVDTETVSFSDHCLLSFKYKKPRVKTPSPILYKSVKSADPLLVIDELNKIDWLSLDNIESFLCAVNSSIDPLIPLQLKSSSTCTSFLSNRYFTLAKKRNEIYRSYLNSRDPMTLLFFKKIRKICNKIALEDKRSFFRRKIDYCMYKNPRKMWSIYNSFFKPESSSEIVKISHNNEFITDKTTIATIFNDYFISSCDIFHSSVVSINVCPANLPFFIDTFDFITPTDICTFIDSLSASSLDHCFISKHLFKIYPTFFANVFSYFINDSLSKGVYPSCFKVSKVIPIFKKGSNLDIRNFRPISVNSLLSKIYEKAVLQSIYKYLCVNKLLCDHQYGFIPQSSTENALIALLDKVSLNTEKVALILVDLSKAFDCIDHKILIDKLSFQFGFRGNVLKWFSSYLHSRFQYVDISGFTSPSKPVTKGVPQGSVLGPLLFNLFINDFPSSITFPFVDTILYADDICLIVRATSESELIYRCETVISCVMSYCGLNKLFMNSKKTKVMPLHNCCVNTKSLSVNGSIIDLVSRVKYLGYLIDSDLSFKPHSAELCNTINRCNILLSRSSRLLTEAHLIRLYKCFILPHIIYHKYVIFFYNKRSVKNLGTKLLTSGSVIYNCSRSSVLDKIFDVSYVVSYYIALFMFKVCRNYYPKISSMVPKKNHTYNTRGISIQVQPHKRLQFKALLSKWCALPSKFNNQSKISALKNVLTQTETISLFYKS